MEFRRKLYPRGSSFETTIPKPLLFAIDQAKKHEVVFSYNKKDQSWTIRIEESSERRQQRA